MFHTVLRGISLVFLVFAVTSCGSSGSTGTQQIIVESPESDSTYAAGGVITYRISTSNFSLAVPHNLRTGRTSDHEHSDHEHGEAEESHGESHQTEMQDGHDMSEAVEAHAEEHDHGAHDHSSDETNPHAREGHFHIYLDDASGSDPHVTAWTQTGEFPLPNTLESGVHSLRFELRDNNHVIIGTSKSEAVLFFNVE